MDLFLSKSDRKRGIARAIYEQLRRAIAEARLRPGDVLPPSRELAQRLGVSRFTVTTAYGYLVAEGFLVGARGGGTQVARDLPSPPAPGSARKKVPPRQTNVLSPLVFDRRYPLDLRIGLPDPELFPYDDWRRICARAVRELRAAEAHYGDAAGDPALRAAIAAWIHRSRGVRADVDQVVITAGAQQAFDLIICALTQTGDTIAVEDPGYPPFWSLAKLRGRKIAPVPVDSEGLIVGALPKRAALVYVTPSHQFPLGAAMSLRRRSDLLEWAQRAGALIAEDDYDSEFRFSDRPLEPLQRLDQSGRVLYVGSFSKTLLPSLRAGFVVAPPELAGALAGYRQLADWGSPLFLQRALAGLIARGHLDRHLRRARKIYGERHRVIVEWFASSKKPFGRLIAVDVGLHFAVELDGALPAHRVIEGAAAAGLGVEDLAKYRIQPGPPGLCLGYGLAPVNVLRRALPVLEKVVTGRADRSSYSETTRSSTHRRRF